MMYGRPVGHKRFFFLSVVAFFLLLLLLLFSLQKFKVCFLLFKNSGKCFPSTPKFLHALQARESLTGRREMIPLSFLLCSSLTIEVTWTTYAQRV
jgi:hypothetical protein